MCINFTEQHAIYKIDMLSLYLLSATSILNRWAYWREGVADLFRLVGWSMVFNATFKMIQISWKNINILSNSSVSRHSLNFRYN